MNKHEDKVNNFYSSGSKTKQFDYHTVKHPDEGFLSFGYWEKKTKGYLAAAKNLLEFFISNSKISNADNILNVACGYGTETFAFYHKFRPHKIRGIDITKLHVDYANNKAKALGLSNKISFTCDDACVLDFPRGHFSHVFAIEGPAHFNTREKFFNAAYRILKKKGELLITDIILGQKFNIKKIFHKLIIKIASKAWVAPKENLIKEKKYRSQVKKAGFTILFFKNIGRNVFPGYAKSSFNKEVLKSSIKRRGLFFAIGLMLISWLLGWLYHLGFIDYVYMKAQKI